MKRFIVATTALFFAATAGALSEAQRKTHFNQILSGIGATVVDCPSSMGQGYTCATYSGSASLATKAWDLYADWSSKVSLTAAHSTPWKTSDKGITTAAFKVGDDTYAVSVGGSGAGSTIVATWSGATVPLVSGSGALPSVALTDNAAPTRKGPVVIGFGSLQTYSLIGPVKQIIRKSYKIQNGQQALSETLTATFTPAGQLISAVTVGPAGQLLRQETNSYQGDRVVRREYVDDKGKKTTYVMEYGGDGNIVSRTSFDSSNTKQSVTRYEIKPNGYIASDFGASGDATTKTYVLQDEQGREIDQEIRGKASTRILSKFVGDLMVSSTVSLSGLTLTTEYANGQELKSVTTGTGIFSAANSTQIYRYDAKDAKGNFLKRSKGKQQLSFGEIKMVVDEVEEQEIVYY